MSTIKAKKTDTQIETNLRRRTAYGEMPSEQKAARLERRRLQYAVKRQTTLENSTTTTSKESSSSLEPCSIVLHQHTLYMRDKPLASRNVQSQLMSLPITANTICNHSNGLAFSVWCIFQIDLTDVTGSTIALISSELSEKMLSMTTEDIFDTICVKLQLLRLDHIHQMLSNKSFNIQLKKSSWVSTNVTHTSLTIVSFTEKEQVLPLTIDQRIAKKAKPLATSNQEMKPTIVEFGSSSETLALEPLTPTK
ncbi:hypothetical protein CQW23_02579 [Capsicum baccatum]|uniref:Uncharacterized protein n=1 Tax=Capsicum baccatum TaxID=33114 RepID=A0A2G2XRT3_CAPBA|nr:hypothetical protein CQW23_02579 [Capsicum baccatum]